MGSPPEVLKAAMDGWQARLLPAPLPQRRKWYVTQWHRYPNPILDQRSIPRSRHSQFWIIFTVMQYPSKLVEEATDQISKLPGIGKKSALRLVLYLLKEEKIQTEALAGSLLKLRQEIKYCKSCHNIADSELCAICSSPRRDRSVICVVEDTRDVMAIENTAQFTGLYHILGGVISPINGVGPSDLKIDALFERVKQEGTAEVILALSPTMEGDTTAFYITKKLKGTPAKITTIARGVPIGGELEYADEVTLGRSILRRTPYETQ